MIVLKQKSDVIPDHKASEIVSYGKINISTGKPRSLVSRGFWM